uniref:Tudor domain-containing protein n=1 Tax=Globodera pallida TaxID=36090 RepID=A0A183BQW9_GLOPA
MSRELGRRTARKLVEEWPTLFMFDRDAPELSAFRPQKPLDPSLVEPNEENLRKMIMDRRVSDAIKLYQKIVGNDENEVDVSKTSKLHLFRLACYYNEEDFPLTEFEEWHAIRYFYLRQNESTEWKEGGIAERLFAELPKTEELFSTLICAMCKFRGEYSLRRARELYKEMTSIGLIPFEEAFNSLLFARVPLDDSSVFNKKMENSSSSLTDRLSLTECRVNLLQECRINNGGKRHLISFMKCDDKKSNQLWRPLLTHLTMLAGMLDEVLSLLENKLARSEDIERTGENDAVFYRDAMFIAHALNNEAQIDRLMKVFKSEHNKVFFECDDVEQRVLLLKIGSAAFGRVHRVVLNTQANCVLSHVVSTSCIWFKLSNHITDRLQLTRDQLKKLDASKTLESFQYVMAPLNENTYARGRVLGWNDTNQRIVYVHFIDEGYGAWMYKDCVALMEPIFFFHPWQAFPISLFKTSKLINTTREVLVRVLKEFPLFYLIPAMGSPRTASANNYYDHARAEVYAFKSVESETTDQDNKAVSILHILTLSSRPAKQSVIRRAVFEARQIPLVKQETIEELTDEALSSIPEWRKSFPPESISTSDCGLSSQMAQAKLNDDNWGLRAEKSPHEFYAFALMQPSTSGTSMEVRKDPVRALFEYQIALADQLDGFYGKTENRRQFEPHDIALQLKTGPVFAILKSNKNVFTGREDGTFRRVQIISIRNLSTAADFGNEFCRIRYIDVGGSEIVPLSGLLQMHPDHSKIVPICMQLTLESINPPNRASEWLSKECIFFRSLIRTDRAMSCRIRPLTQSSAYQPTSYNSSPHRWVGVFGVGSLVNGNLRVEEQMVKGVVKQEGIRETMAAWSSLGNGYH